MGYNLGNVKPHVRAVANKVGPMFGIKTAYGYSYRNIAGTSVLSDHATGLAVDFMCNIPTGNRLAAYMKANAHQYGVKYVIHNRQIWSVARNGEGWRHYSGVNPHTDHVHVSFNGKAGSGGTTTPPKSGSGNATPAGIHVPDPRGLLGGIGGLVGGGGAVVGGIGDVAQSLASVAKIVVLLLQPATWIRATMFLVGLMLIAIAIGMLIKNTSAAQAATQAATKAVKAAARAKASA